MPEDTSVVIGRRFAEFVERQVGDGRYESPRDVVQAALRLLEERELRIDALRSALVEGEESGPATPFDFDAFIAGKLGDASSRE